MMNDNSEVTYEIVEEIGVISTHDTGWNKELNLVSWNGGTAKYDIRDWAPDHSMMGRGITLQEQEMRNVLSLLKRRRRSAAGRAPRQIRSSGTGASDSGFEADGSGASSETAAGSSDAFGKEDMAAAV